MWHAGFKKYCYSTMFNYEFDLAVWYPAIQQESVIPYSPMYDGSVAPNALIAEGKFPLIAFSCGYAGSHYDHAYLAETLARSGFIVVGFSRHDFEKKRGLKEWGIKRIWYRAYEMKLAIQYVLTHWQSSIEHQVGISVFGFSAGAFTSLLLSGAVPDFKRKTDFKIYPKELEQYDFSKIHEAKIKNLVLMAPIFSDVFNESQLKKVVQPALLLTAEKDEIIKNSAEKYNEYLPNLRDSYCLRNVGHYIFNGPFNSLASRILPNAAVLRLHQELYHPFIQNHVVNFFKKQLISVSLGESHVS
jgi:predicted dienelactone hydrolase